MRGIGGEWHLMSGCMMREVHGNFTYGVGDIGVGNELLWAGLRDLNLA